MIRNARPYTEAHPELAKRVRAEIARRGRPPLEHPKVQVSMRLDQDLLDRLKAGGKGWQTRVNAMLRDAVGI